jgi:altronate dehydratase
MNAAGVIRLHPADTVAVALRDLAAGAQVRWQGGSQAGDIVVREAVSLGHKISLMAVPKDSPITKYGATIGIATQDIAKGAHVHVHNIASARARSRS